MTNTEVLSLVIAIGFGVFSIVGVMIALFLWNRGESNSDRRDAKDSVDKIRHDLERIHGRLRRIEGRRR